MPLSRFILISFKRSGTGWLKTMLESHPNIRMEGEPVLRWREHQTVGPTFVRLVLDKLYSMEPFSPLEMKQYKMVEHGYEEKQEGPCVKALGFKWLYGQVGVPEAAHRTMWFIA